MVLCPFPLACSLEYNICDGCGQEKETGGGSPPPALFSAFPRRCCPRHGPRRHPACGYSYPPAFSWGPCRRASSSPAPRRPSIRRSYRPKIRCTSSSLFTPLRHEASMTGDGATIPGGIFQISAESLPCGGGRIVRPRSRLSILTHYPPRVSGSMACGQRAPFEGGNGSTISPSLPVYTAGAKGGLCIGRNCADTLGAWGPLATNKWNRIYIRVFLTLTDTRYFIKICRYFLTNY